MNRERLGIAYNNHTMEFVSYYRGWPIHRCSICGKMEYPNGLQHIGQIEPEFTPPYYICHDHGGKDGKTYIDCFTGCEVTVGSEPNVLWKVITDPMKESIFWIWVLIKYDWLTAKDAVLTVLYWRRIRRAKLAWRKIQEDYSGEE